MQRRTPDGGITTTDDFVEHVPGCASVAHNGLTCEEAVDAFRKGRMGRKGQSVTFTAARRTPNEQAR